MILWLVDRDDVFGRHNLACHALRVENLDAHFLQIGRAVGPPGNNDHKLAMPAAIVTASAVVK